MTTETPKTKQAHFIGRCPVKSCRCVMHVDVPMKDEGRMTRGIPGVPGSAQHYTVKVPAYSPTCFLIHCARHRWPVGFKRVDGRVSEDHVCDARCMNAIGSDCECSCGGANHGRAFHINT